MKYLKWFGIFILLLVVTMVACTAVMSKKLPATVAGDGDALAQSMLTALNKPAWDTLGYLQWTFMGSHHYAWDKHNNIANIQWGKNEVIMDLDDVDGDVFTNGVAVTDEKKRNKLLDRAWSFWCNDSFWMFAPFKIFDPGTTREVVSIEQEPNTQGLKVTYQGGGVTPGDTYVWALDEKNVPIGYYMWVDILPVKGLYSSWDNWIDIANVKLSTAHKMSVLKTKMTNVKGGETISSIDLAPEKLTLH